MKARKATNTPPKAPPPASTKAEEVARYFERKRIKKGWTLRKGAQA